SVLFQSLFQHRYAAHRMYDMPKRTERVMHFLAFLVQGSSYLNPRAYAILHREHHAFSDTDHDPHTPWLHSNAMSMMWKTKKRYSDYAHGRAQPEPRFDGGCPDWPWLEDLADAWPTRIAFGMLYSVFYLSFATHWWQLAFMLPFHFVMGPVHGAIESWGRYPQARHAAEVRLNWRAGLTLPVVGPMLPYGQGRSYGDSCLNDGGKLLRTAGLDRFISFDEGSGLLRCEAGLTLGEILRLLVPRGFFLPVVPGTKHVSVGGAIANDIHGKNHHRAGSFGAHVRRLELLRSDGDARELEPDDRLFQATVGGLGLTGLVTWAE